MPPFRVGIVSRHVFLVFLLNTFVALGIAASGSVTFIRGFIHAQFIGLIIWVLIDGGRYFFAKDGALSPVHSALLVMSAVPVGYVAGTALADWSVGLSPWNTLGSSPRSSFTFLLLSFAAAGTATYYILSQESIARQRFAESNAKRLASEAHLKLLESQLEPHMLFNTLATMRAMIDSEPQDAKAMLDKMVGYLRGTLDASLRGEHSVRAEFERLENYLDLMSSRLGPRLCYSFSLPDDVMTLAMPALLLQPLVENSIRHGLEPKERGGWIRISGRLRREVLILQIEDNGVGLDRLDDERLFDDLAQQEREERARVDARGFGFGLSSVRDRLSGTYGKAAGLEVVRSPSGGTLVTVCIEHARVSQ